MNRRGTQTHTHTNKKLTKRIELQGSSRDNKRLMSHDIFCFSTRFFPRRRAIHTTYVINHQREMRVKDDKRESGR